MPHRPLLIVEDDPAIQDLVVLVLIEAGYVVEAVTRPERAVTLLVERGPAAFAAVITRPFITPQDDRYLWLRRLQAVTTVPIIITVRWPASWFADYRERGYAGLIQQPSAPEEIVARVNSVLGGEA